MTETPTLAQRLRNPSSAPNWATADRWMIEAAAALEAQAAQIATMQARERACATMDEAQKVSLIRALQECCQALGLDAMKTSPAELVKAVSVQAAQIAERDAQIEALRADALRYRWLRDECRSKHTRGSQIAANEYGSEWDERIDAAMAAKEPK